MLHVSYSTNPSPTSAVRPRDSDRAGQDASGAPVPPPSSPTPPNSLTPPSSRGSDLRKACRRAASLLVRHAASLSPLAAMARALGVGASRAEDYADPEHEAAIALGDVMALPTVPAVAILEGALAHVRERAGEKVVHLAPEVRGMQAAGSGARVAHAVHERLDDGKLDATERREVVRVLREESARLQMIADDLERA